MHDPNDHIWRDAVYCAVTIVIIVFVAGCAALATRLFG